MATVYREVDVPSQQGKTALVTGANTGIGFHTARVLAARGARVLLGCRDESRAAEAIAAIQSKLPDADLAWLPLDLASLSSIEKAAGQVQQTESHLDLLINNAGVMVPPKTLTEDGFELQFGVNHLGHFALTGHLLPMLKARADARIVNISSLAHRGAAIDFDDIHAERKYSRMKRYQMSKFANMLFTFGLQQRLEASGASALAVAAHPGGSNTELGRHIGLMRFLFLPLEWIMNSAAEGALPSLRAATDPDAKGGDYYGPTGMGEFARSAGIAKVDPAARDLEAINQLWGISEALTNVSI
jgi:NAD(P)-dependent dehydrogenase (short-subunit alcohol dehydrogenase family)